MNLIKKFVSISIILSVGVFSIAQKNQLTNSELIEQSLYWENVYFNSDSNTEKTISILNRSQVLIKLDKKREALKLLEKIVYFNLSDTLMYQSYKLSAHTAYLLNRYSKTDKFLRQIYAYTPELIDSDLIRLSVFTYNEINRYDLSKIQMIKLIENKQDDSLSELIKEVNMLYEKLPKLKKPNKARSLATAFPGLGHIYANKPLKGLLNLSLISGSFAAGIYAFTEKYYFSSFFMYSLGIKFYEGGRNSSYYFAGQLNYKRTKLFSSEIKKFISENKL